MTNAPNDTITVVAGLLYRAATFRDAAVAGDRTASGLAWAHARAAEALTFPYNELGPDDHHDVVESTIERLRETATEGGYRHLDAATEARFLAPAAPRDPEVETVAETYTWEWDAA